MYAKQDSDYCVPVPVLNHTKLEGLDLVQTIADALCCPDCRAEVSLSEEAVSCTACGKSYPIAEGIPQFAEMGAELGIEPQGTKASLREEIERETSSTAEEETNISATRAWA